jgi:hypothetical protein
MQFTANVGLAGDYDLPCMHDAPAYTIAARHTLPDTCEVNPVGPGDYCVPAAFPAGPAYTMPQADLIDTDPDADALPGA